MNYGIIHELPGRIRFCLALPASTRKTDVEKNFEDLTGVKKVSFSPRTRNLLILFDGAVATRNAALERIEAASYPGLPYPKQNTELDKKRRAAICAGGLLLLRPLFPPSLLPLVAFWGAFPILRRGIIALLRRQLNVAALDASAIGAAMATGNCLTASVISFLLKLGDYLEEWTRRRSRQLLSEMFHAGEEWAWVVRDHKELRVPLQDVCVGDTVVVRMASLIPVDGAVLHGEALVNESTLTGESIPVKRRQGETVYAGTVVEEGSIRIRALQLRDQTRIAKIIKTIEEAGPLKAETESRSEMLAERIVPYSFLLSGLTFALSGNATRSAAVLLVDYSCAIKISTPLAILASIATAARHRVLIKGGKHLEKLARADAYILDKTGTLTGAVPTVAEVIPFNGYSREYILTLAACVEEHFTHPVAKAVVRLADEERLSHTELHGEVEYVPARGVVSRINGSQVVMGSGHFVQTDKDVSVSAAEPLVRRFSEKGYSVLYIAINGELAGVIAIHDPLRDEAGSFVGGLRASGINRIVMLTGDNEAAARTIAGRLGITEFHALTFPEKKVEVVKQLQSAGYTVAVVGDGINDSPALAHADVGISMKHGADIAREASDVLLMEGTLADLLHARRISIEALNLVEKNFRAIVILNTLAMGMALTGIVSPIISAALHNLTTIGVGLRALKLLRR